MPAPHHTFLKAGCEGINKYKIITRSHPEIVGDMPHVTLNFDLSKTPFVHF